MAEQADVSLCAIDCGFDPRVHPEMVCAIPRATRSVAYEHAGQRHVMCGSAAQIVYALRAHGYRVRLVD
jgi:hypothetical protein